MYLRRVIREDWQWICDWFRDEQLNQKLGPLDEDWLRHVLEHNDGAQLVAIDDGEPVALIGCAWSAAAETPHGITDIAVSPHRRHTGLGRKALAAVVEWEGHPAGRGWVAFVEPRNKAAQAFFTRVGWRYCGIDDDMHRFELTDDLTSAEAIQPIETA